MACGKPASYFLALRDDVGCEACPAILFSEGKRLQVCSPRCAHLRWSCIDLRVRRCFVTAELCLETFTCWNCGRRDALEATFVGYRLGTPRTASKVSKVSKASGQPVEPESMETMETWARGAYEAHRQFAGELCAAVEHGQALLRAFDRKAIRTPGVRFRPEVRSWRDGVRRALGTTKQMRVGAGRLRCLLDALVSAAVPVRLEPRILGPDDPSPTHLYFGFQHSGGAVRLAPCSWMTMQDVAAVRQFAAHLAATLDAAGGVRAAAEGHPCEAELDALVAEHREHLGALDGMAREFAATCLQRAWRRCHDTPGFAVWKKRMLREFEELEELTYA